MNDILVTLTGPSCAGKTTLEERLIERGFARVISNTSRAPRAGEVDGVHYQFRSRAWFDEKILACELVEFVDFNGNYYGNTEQDIRSAVERGHGKAVWVVEPVGHKQIKEWFAQRRAPKNLELLSVFVNGDLAERLRRFMLRWREDGCPGTGLRRIDPMVGIEQQWTAEAMRDYGGPQELYDVVLKTYDETNGHTALALIDTIAIAVTDQPSTKAA